MPFYSAPVLPRKFCFELVGSDSGMDTIRFPASDTILEVTREGPVIRCLKCANSVSCCGCGGLVNLNMVYLVRERFVHLVVLLSEILSHSGHFMSF
jgi:hypothetical protein